MTKQVEITREADARGGRYVAKVAGGEGELTYRVREDGVVVANHTGVSPALQGQGIALKLVERLVADARAKGFRIVPACSYVAAQKQRHPEWADVFA